MKMRRCLRTDGSKPWENIQNYILFLWDLVLISVTRNLRGIVPSNLLKRLYRNNVSASKHSFLIRDPQSHQQFEVPRSVVCKRFHNALQIWLSISWTWAR
jgi:hypothetical protein